MNRPSLPEDDDDEDDDDDELDFCEQNKGAEVGIGIGGRGSRRR